MPFPTIRQYSDVLQLPVGERPFRSPQLDDVNYGEIVPTGSRFLHWGAGSFAIVFRCIGQSGTEVALRCLLAPPPQDIAERYQALEEYLQSLSTDILPLVRAHYIEDAVKVEGAYRPVFLMDWVEGQTLESYVRQRIQQHDQPALYHLADQWRELLLTLQSSSIAHGDLQPRNIMVSPSNELKLVDYDTIFVPSLSERVSPAVGTPGYVHPVYLQGGSRPYNAEMDTFSGLLIFLSLLALARDPSLYGKFSQDNLLFSETDLLDPDSSPAFQTLLSKGEPLVVFLTERLKIMCHHVTEAEVALGLVLEGVPCEPFNYAPPIVPKPQPLSDSSPLLVYSSYDEREGTHSILPPFTKTWSDANAAVNISVRMLMSAIVVAALAILFVMILSKQFIG